MTVLISISKQFEHFIDGGMFG